MSRMSDISGNESKGAAMAVNTNSFELTERAAQAPSPPPRPVPSPAPPVRVPQPPAEKLAGRSTRRRAAKAAIGVFAAAALALAAASAGGAQAPGDLVDRRGDSKGDAPDIVGVAVSNDAKGELSVAVLFLGGSIVAPPADVRVTLVLDTDKNAATGSNGFDYAFQFDALENTHGVGKWDGTQFSLVDAPSAAVTWTAISLIFTINRSDLGGTSAFDFWVRSHYGPNESGQTDDAPDDGVWSFTFAAPKASKLTLSTLRPRAGKVLDARGARLQLTDGSSIAPERLTCRLTAGRAVVKPLAGGCRWRLPQRLKGKTVVLTLVAAYGDSELRLTRRAVVR